MSCLTRRSLLAAAGLAAAGTTSMRHLAGAQSAPPGKIAFVRAGDIYQWEGGNTTQLIQNGAALSPRWSPDGSQLIYVQAGDSFSDLYLATLEDGSTLQLTYNEATDYQIGSQDYVENSAWVVDPAWSKSGVVGYASDPFTPYGRLALWIMDSVGDDPVRYLPAPSTYYDDDQYYQDVEGISISDDGSVAAYTTRLQDPDTGDLFAIVQIQDLSTTETATLADDADGAFDPSLEPYGSRVAMAIRAGEVSDIWLIDRDGGARTQITSGANATKPCWSNDGSWLAYVQMVDFKFEVWAVPINGATIGTPQKLFNFDDFDAPSGLCWWVE